MIRRGLSTRSWTNCVRPPRRASNGCSDLEAKEREETGIKTLRIQYNRVFGYYIEVTKSYYNLVPLRYAAQADACVQRRALHHSRSCARSKAKITRRARSRARRTGAGAVLPPCRSEIAARHASPFSGTRQRAQNRWTRCFRWRSVARDYGYVAPTHQRRPATSDIVRGPASRWWSGWCQDTPVRAQRRSSWTPRTTGCSSSPAPTWPARAPICARRPSITLMAHIGSFVPAKRSEHQPVRPHLHPHRGSATTCRPARATFMVEMSETAGILRSATERIAGHSGRDRPGHQHLRRPEPLRGRRWNTCCDKKKMRREDAVRHPLS